MDKETEVRHILGKLFTLRLPASLNELQLDRFPVANYIVFRDNLETSFEASQRRLAEARLSLRAKGIEPLFMMDEEGGRVTQISRFFESAPSARAVSRTLKPEEAGRLYGHMAAYVADLGIDINLFPCVDVGTEPLNPVIGTRSYGSMPEDVSMYTRAAIRSSRAHTACIVKHFPGHGMTRLDSHLDRPTVELPRERLDYIHINPFREAVRSGADGIMVNHCLYLSLQNDDRPASLSKQVVGDILRKKLRYDGLVITDSLDMRAVTAKIDPHRVGMLALEAGNDILLYTEYSDRFERSFEAILEAVFMDRMRSERLARSVKRREYLIDRLDFARSKRSAYQEDEYLDLLAKVRAKSVTVRDAGGVLPLSYDRAVIVSTSETVTEKIRKHIPSLAEGEAVTDATGSTLILWFMEPFHPRVPFEVVRGLIESARRTVLITTYEHLAEILPTCDVTIISDDTSPHSEETILRTLFG
ncbi:MAG: glycoside hydrolase family 3 N-terminal domain-containing protein [Candidatus Eisenbacteria bacterium]